MLLGGTQRQWLSSGADSSARAHLREALDLQHCAAVGVVLVLEGVRQALQQAVPRVPWPEVTRPSRQSPACPNKVHGPQVHAHIVRGNVCVKEGLRVSCGTSPSRSGGGRTRGSGAPSADTCGSVGLLVVHTE